MYTRTNPTAQQLTKATRLARIREHPVCVTSEEDPDGMGWSIHYRDERYCYLAEFEAFDGEILAICYPDGDVE